MAPKKPRIQARDRNRTAGQRHRAPNRKPYVLTFKRHGDKVPRRQAVQDLNEAQAIVNAPGDPIVLMPIVRDRASRVVALLSVPTVARVNCPECNHKAVYIRTREFETEFSRVYMCQNPLCKTHRLYFHTDHKK